MVTKHTVVIILSSTQMSSQLHCTPEINIFYVNYVSREKKHKEICNHVQIRQVNKAFNIYSAFGFSWCTFLPGHWASSHQFSLCSSGPGHLGLLLLAGPLRGGGVSSSWTLLAFLQNYLKLKMMKRYLKNLPFHFLRKMKHQQFITYTLLSLHGKQLFCNNRLKADS